MKKTAGIITLLIVVLLAGYLVYRYFFSTCCALPLEQTSTTLWESDSDPTLDDPDLIYARRALIGLCRTKSGSGGSCHSNTYLYASGKLTVESGEVAMEPDGEKRIAYPTVKKVLDKDLMDRVTTQIRDSGILDKPCEAEMITDYYVSYFVHLDGRAKEAKFPGCEAEFNAIDKLIDAVE